MYGLLRSQIRQQLATSWLSTKTKQVFVIGQRVSSSRDANETKLIRSYQCRRTPRVIKTHPTPRYSKIFHSELPILTSCWIVTVSRFFFFGIWKSLGPNKQRCHRRCYSHQTGSFNCVIIAYLSRPPLLPNNFPVESEIMDRKKTTQTTACSMNKKQKPLTRQPSHLRSLCTAEQ